MPIPRRARVLAPGAIGLLVATSACGTADPNLFRSDYAPSGISPSAGTVGIAGSGGSVASGGAAGLVSGGGGGESSGGSGGSGVGCAFSCGDGGRVIGGSGGGDSGGQAGSASDLTECSAFATDATFLPSTQHCYLLDSEPRTFAAAETHCKELNAHLITLGSEAENDFAWSLHGDEHWIGSQDGKAPKQAGAGKYTWVTNEPFAYTNWSRDQPNASKTDCVEGGAECYEHCAFQWKGGDHDNQWNDRYCMHTIASICEWDSLP